MRLRVVATAPDISRIESTRSTMIFPSQPRPASGKTTKIIRIKMARKNVRLWSSRRTRAKMPCGCGVSSILNSGGFNFPAPRSGSHGTSVECGCQCFGSGVKDRFFDCRDDQAQGEGNWQISFGLASSSIFPSLTSFTAHTRLSSDSRGVCRSKSARSLYGSGCLT